MNYILRWSILFIFLAINAIGVAVADEKLDKATLETLIKGNSAEGKNLVWNITYKMYFDPTGRFRRIDSRGNREGGDWEIEKDGTLFMMGNKNRRRTVKQRSDGGYNVYNRRGDIIWTMEKVTPGNAYNLTP